ncbi:MAG: HNH endonuclease family protein [Candidatus Saccharimonadales bacterium]
MKTRYIRIVKLVIVLVIALVGAYKTNQIEAQKYDDSIASVELVKTPAGEVLATISIKGRAPKTNYSREQFGDGWEQVSGCDMRNRILARDLREIYYVPTTDFIVCKVMSGVLDDPYTNKLISFQRGPETSDDVQIDHVVALSDAWQKGAQNLTPEQRLAFANDPLELLAVDGNANQQKADSDAATWLPANKSYRCSYVARQIAVKKKYSLWVTRSEYDTMAQVLKTCPDQKIPV